MDKQKLKWLLGLLAAILTAAVSYLNTSCTTVISAQRRPQGSTLTTTVRTETSVDSVSTKVQVR